jgi:hypothetical protein
VIEHDSLSITQSLLERVAAGEELSEGESEWAGFIARYFKSRYQVEGCWIETPRQRHERFLADKRRREKHSSKEVVT